MSIVKIPSKKFSKSAKSPKSNDKKTKLKISTKSTDESQAEESDSDNQEAEIVVRDTLMIASMKNLIEEALNNQISKSKT